MKSRVPIHIYNLYLDIYYAKTDKEADKIHRKLLGKFGLKSKERHDARATAYSQYCDKKGFRIQALLFKETGNPDVDVYAHEALHCTFSILNRAGVEYCPKSEEAFTYLQGFLTQTVYNEVEKMRKKK